MKISVNQLLIARFHD